MRASASMRLRLTRVKSGHSPVMGQFERRAFAPQSRSQRPEKLFSGPMLTARSANCARWLNESDKRSQRASLEAGRAGARWKNGASACHRNYT